MTMSRQSFFWVRVINVAQYFSGGGTGRFLAYRRSAMCSRPSDRKSLCSESPAIAIAICSRQKKKREKRRRKKKSIREQALYQCWTA